MIRPFFESRAVPLTVGGYLGWANTLWPKGAVLFGSPKNVSWMAVAAIGVLCLGALSTASQLGLLRSRRSEGLIVPNEGAGGAIESALAHTLPNVVIEHANVVNIIQRGPDDYEATVRIQTHAIILQARYEVAPSLGAQATVIPPAQEIEVVIKNPDELASHWSRLVSARQKQRREVWGYGEHI